MYGLHLLYYKKSVSIKAIQKDCLKIHPNLSEIVVGTLEVVRVEINSKFIDIIVHGKRRIASVYVIKGEGLVKNDNCIEWIQAQKIIIDEIIIKDKLLKTKNGKDTYIK